MEWHRLKNIIILILLLLNGFLLVLVGSRRREAAQYDQKALEHTVEVLAGRGIEVDPDGLSDPGKLPPLSLERDLEAEREMVRALLDEAVEADNRGGGLYLYRGALGEVSVRAGGELSAVLADDPFWDAGSPEDRAAALLKKMGVSARRLGVETREGRTAVRFQQLWNQTPVFSCEVEFVYENGRLSAIQGTLLTAGQGLEETGEILSVPTALLRFLEGVTATGDVCSAIRSMEAGYRIVSQPLSGGVRLTAVWLVSSNTADYYLDGATGALTRLTGR